MVGVAVVTLFTVFASSIKASVNLSVDKSFGGVSGGGAQPDLRAGPGHQPRPLAPTWQAEAWSTAAWGVGGGLARVDDKDLFVAVADPVALNKVVKLDVRQGDLAKLGRPTCHLPEALR